MLPETLSEVETPALIVDLDILEHNLQRMAGRMKDLDVALRPHFKTHKCLEIAEMQKALGAVGFTASTLAEADVLRRRGEDVTWAFPLILSKLPGLEMTGEGVLRLLVDSPEAVTALEERFVDADGFPVHVWLKVDCGYHRAGVDPESSDAVELARRLHESSRLTFDGIVSHSGHAYDVRTRKDLLRIAEEERRVMAGFADRLRGDSIEVSGVSVGSTPAMSVVENLDGVTEARPGNYVFYDASQVEIGSCEVGDCALTVLSSVVSSQPGARHSVLDAGALTLSKDLGPSWVEPSYGRIYSDYARHELDSELRIASVSQEHGIVRASLPVRSRVRILMNHSCLTVPHFSHYWVARGEEIVDSWPICFV